MNRICPSEEQLSQYISGTLSEQENTLLEKHLTTCESCRQIILETHEILKENIFLIIYKKIISFYKKNIWFIFSCISLLCSFLLKRYFFQFITFSIITGLKWIIDNKTTKTLIMINEAWKNKKNQSEKNNNNL